jgi:hypothetical protein
MYARETGEFIEFPTLDEAIDFSIFYKIQFPQGDEE